MQVPITTNPVDGAVQLNQSDVIVLPPIVAGSPVSAVMPIVVPMIDPLAPEMVVPGKLSAAKAGGLATSVSKTINAMVAIILSKVVLFHTV